MKLGLHKPWFWGSGFVLLILGIAWTSANLSLPRLEGTWTLVTVVDAPGWLVKRHIVAGKEYSIDRNGTLTGEFGFFTGIVSPRSLFQQRYRLIDVMLGDQFKGALSEDGSVLVFSSLKGDIFFSARRK